MPEMDRDQIEEVTCREFVELVGDYWEGALSADQMELVEEHLVICDLCKTYLDQMETTVKALPDSGEPVAVPEDTRRILLSAFRDWKARR